MEGVDGSSCLLNSKTMFYLLNWDQNQTVDLNIVLKKKSCYSEECNLLLELL